FSLVSQTASPTEQGKVLGINHSMGSLGRVLGPLWGGFAFNFYGYQSPFITAGVFTFITLFIGFTTFRKNVNTKESV
ncbi:MAG: MFS transporter, partial [Actinobacteria bacterium]|nr:MFS transporter [Actinomycetota bacterium]